MHECVSHLEGVITVPSPGGSEHEKVDCLRWSSFLRKDSLAVHVGVEIPRERKFVGASATTATLVLISMIMPR